jgi:hypothetical protein
MKSMTYKSILLFFLIAISSCEKQPFDYRTKYIGDYTFSIHFKSWAGVYPPYSEVDTSYTSEGWIEYGLNETTIRIYLSSTDSWNIPDLYEDGTIDGYGWTGEFVNSKKLIMKNVYLRPSGASVTTVEGNKK